MSNQQDEYPIDTISKLLMLSHRRVQQLTELGVLKQSVRNRYQLVATVQGYITFLKDSNAREEDGTVIDYKLERARKMRAEAALSEIEVNKANSKLISVDEVTRAVIEDYLRVKNRLRTIPSRVCPLIVGERDIVKIKSALSTEIDDVLTDLGNEFNLLIYEGKQLEGDRDIGAGAPIPEAATDA